jgi:hypothetical protein
MPGPATDRSVLSTRREWLHAAMNLRPTGCQWSQGRSWEESVPCRLDDRGRTRQSGVVDSMYGCTLSERNLTLGPVHAIANGFAEKHSCVDLCLIETPLAPYGYWLWLDCTFVQTCIFVSAPPSCQTALPGPLTNCMVKLRMHTELMFIPSSATRPMKGCTGRKRNTMASGSARDVWNRFILSVLTAAAATVDVHPPRFDALTSLCPSYNRQQP